MCFSEFLILLLNLPFAILRSELVRFVRFARSHSFFSQHVFRLDSPVSIISIFSTVGLPIGWWFHVSLTLFHLYAAFRFVDYVFFQSADMFALFVVVVIIFALVIIQ